VERADRDRVREVAGGRRRADGEGEHVDAVGHRREHGGEDVHARAPGLVARLVRGRALPAPEDAGARGERAPRGGQRVRAVPVEVPRRGQVRLARRPGPARRQDARAEDPSADQLAAPKNFDLHSKMPQ
jgi:hypothetical protein